MKLLSNFKYLEDPKRHSIATLAVVGAAMLASACASDPKVAGPAPYAERHSDGNVFACATCHALEEPAADGLIRPGHPIGDAAARPSYKNGQLTSLLDAVNTCRKEWMAAPAFASDDPRWLELKRFLEDAAPAQAPPLVTSLDAPPKDLGGGDSVAGRAVFNSRCNVCHGDDGVGTNLAPQITGLELEPEYIAERVRLSGDETSPVYPNRRGGRMPFWTKDRLSDAELLDVVAYVAESEGTTPPDAGTTPDGSPTRECDATHARVGHVAELSTLFHGVSGTATIVDDCTVRIDMFNFDGQGVDVRVYGASNGNYAAGYSMSDDLRRAGGYTNETTFATLPEGKTLDDLDGISIWCVPVGASFGDGLFQAP